MDYMGATSVRLPDELLRALDRMAVKENADRSTIMKKALEEGLKALDMERAVRAYEGGRITAMRAARDAGVTLWEFLDELKRRGAWFHTDEDTLREQLEALG